ncbi:MAG: class I SAM-dependent methyltransferase [Candidatus Melainabacteria bacterium]|nr:MAG: class I SAM-dependent methyltransferase [Candidatus Melainabacteria bacterium]
MKNDIKKVVVCCNNCGSPDSEFVTTGVEHEYDNTTKDEFTVVKCKHCNLHYLNPRPDVSELETIYPAEYYAYHLQTKNVESENRDSLLYRARKFVYLNRLEKALSHCLANEELKVLDIGCADGRALNWYKKIESKNVRTFGVDFDPIAVQKAREAGHTIYEGLFEEAQIPQNFFDMAVATHVIEHVANPKAFAKRALDVIKPGGILLLETPNINSFDAMLFRHRHWGGYHFPRHWVFYDADTITNLMKELGFDIIEIRYHPAPAFWNWSFHSLLVDKLPYKGLVDYLFPPADFQQNNLKNLCAVSLFTLLDILQQTFTRKTSNMSILLRKPNPS